MPEEKPPQEESSLKRMQATFLGNIQAVRTLNERIGRLAEEHDSATLERFWKFLADLAGVPVEDLLRAKRVTAVSAGADIESRRVPAAPEGGAAGGGDAGSGEQTGNKLTLTARMKEELAKPRRVAELIEQLDLVLKGSPVQAWLLREGGLTVLTSYFEGLLAALLHDFYRRYPQAFPAETGTLTLAEIREIGSLEDAEARLVAKEAESVLRGSLEDQLGYFTKRPKVDLDVLDDYLGELGEVIQRRNLFVHNGGVVNRTYVSKVPKSYLESHDIKLDQRLRIDRVYLDRAIDCILLCGVILLQQCWRKWDKSERGQADDALIQDLYELLSEERYELATRLARVALSLDIEKDSDRRILTINYAIALKELKRTEEMEKLLSTCDWSACSLKFQVALHALRGEEDALFRVLPSAIAAGEIGGKALREWPLFRPFRLAARFTELVASSAMGERTQEARVHQPTV